VLAPVLARLDLVPGVAAARSDSSGRFFWIELATGADEGAVREGARAVLGPRARPLPAPEAAAQLAWRRLGDPWLRTGEVMALSFVEGRLLSVRLCAELERRGAIPGDRGEVVAEAIRVELFAALARVHAEGGRPSSAWIHEEWPAIAVAVRGRCIAALPLELRDRFAEALPTLL
jgi:hypothetical protein